MTESVPDHTSAGDDTTPQEFSHLGWTDSAARRVYFSAGDDFADRDPLAESLVRALRGENTENTIGDATFVCPGVN